MKRMHLITSFMIFEVGEATSTLRTKAKLVVNVVPSTLSTSPAQIQVSGDASMTASCGLGEVIWSLVPETPGWHQTVT